MLEYTYSACTVKEVPIGDELSCAQRRALLNARLRRTITLPYIAVADVIVELIV